MAEERLLKQQLAEEAMLFVAKHHATPAANQVLTALETQSKPLAAEVAAATQNGTDWKKIWTIHEEIYQGKFNAQLDAMVAHKSDKDIAVASAEDRQKLVAFYRQVTSEEKNAPMLFDKLYQASPLLANANVIGVKPDEIEKRIMAGQFDVAAVNFRTIDPDRRTIMGERASNYRDHAQEYNDHMRFPDAATIKSWNVEQETKHAAQIANEASRELMSLQRHAKSLPAEAANEAGRVGARTMHQHLIHDVVTSDAVNMKHDRWHENNRNKPHSPRHDNVVVPPADNDHHHGVER